MKLSILEYYLENDNKVVKNQDKTKNRNNTFEFHDFIHFIADMIGCLYIFHLSLTNIYIYNITYILYILYICYII